VNNDIALVTGGAGFIGSHLVEALLAHGWSVRVLDNFSTGQHGNLAAAVEHIDLITGDLLDPQSLARAVEGADVVFHLAALGSVTRSMEHPLMTHEANSTGTLRVLEAARKAGVRRVVYSSSSSVYGDDEDLPRRELQEAKPLSPYAVSKLVGEHYCRVYARQFSLETVGLRYFNVFGPRQDAQSEYAAVIPRFIESARNGRTPVIFGDGRQTRDFTYVANVVHANLLAAANGVSGESYNIGSGLATSLLELLSFIRDSLGVTLHPRFEPERPGDVRDSLACIEKAQAQLGYEVKVSCFQGLASMLGAAPSAS